MTDGFSASMETTIPSVVAEHLDDHREITLFCRDINALPIGYPMFVFARSQTEIFISTYRKSAKVRHLERDPRVALLSMRSEHPDVVQWVSMTGRAAIWSPSVDEIAGLFDTRPGDARVPNAMTELVRQRTIEGKRIVLRIELDAPELLMLEEATR